MFSKVYPIIIVAGSYAVGKTVACRALVYSESLKVSVPEVHTSAASSILTAEKVLENAVSLATATADDEV